MAEMQFDQIVAEHYATLYRFALSLTRDEAESLALTQQTFYLWATKGGQLRDAAKLKAAPLPEDLLEQIRAGTQARLTMWRQASLPRPHKNVRHEN